MNSIQSRGEAESDAAKDSETHTQTHTEGLTHRDSPPLQLASQQLLHFMLKQKSDRSMEKRRKVKRRERESHESWCVHHSKCSSPVDRTKTHTEPRLQTVSISEAKAFHCKHTAVQVKKQPTPSWLLRQQQVVLWQFYLLCLFSVNSSMKDMRFRRVWVQKDELQSATKLNHVIYFTVS